MTPSVPTPDADIKDYVWCPECEAYHHKKFTQEQVSLFNRAKTRYCPKGHKVPAPVVEETA